MFPCMSLVCAIWMSLTALPFNRSRRLRPSSSRASLWGVTALWSGWWPPTGSSVDEARDPAVMATPSSGEGLTGLTLRLVAVAPGREAGLAGASAGRGAETGSWDRVRNWKSGLMVIENG